MCFDKRETFQGVASVSYTEPTFPIENSREMIYLQHKVYPISIFEGQQCAQYLFKSGRIHIYS